MGLSPRTAALKTVRRRGVTGERSNRNVGSSVAPEVVRHSHTEHVLRQRKFRRPRRFQGSGTGVPPVPGVWTFSVEFGLFSRALTRAKGPTHTSLGQRPRSRPP